MYTYSICPLNWLEARIGSMEKVKEKKVLYHFAVFAIVNELLIIKNHRISTVWLVHWLMQVRDEMRPPSNRSC